MTDHPRLIELIARRSRTIGASDIGHVWIKWKGKEIGYYFDTSLVPGDIRNETPRLISYLRSHRVRGHLRLETTTASHLAKEHPLYQQLYGQPDSPYARRSWILDIHHAETDALLEKLLDVSVVTNRREWGFYSLNSRLSNSNNCVSWARKIITKAVAHAFRSKPDQYSGRHVPVEKVAVIHQLMKSLYIE